MWCCVCFNQKQNQHIFSLQNCRRRRHCVQICLFRSLLHRSHASFHGVIIIASLLLYDTKENERLFFDNFAKWCEIDWISECWLLPDRESIIFSHLLSFPSFSMPQMKMWISIISTILNKRIVFLQQKTVPILKIWIEMKGVTTSLNGSTKVCF